MARVKMVVKSGGSKRVESKVASKSAKKVSKKVSKKSKPVEGK